MYQHIAIVVAAFSPKVRKWVLGRKNWQQQWSLKLTQSSIIDGQQVVWMHASSLGEFEQGSPLLESIKEKWPNSYIVVTFFSPSGYEVRKDYAIANAIGYLPFDHPVDAAKFVELIKPDLVIWVKYEYWYYTLSSIAEKKIPLLLVSGIFRKSQPFFKWYGEIHRNMLTFFSHFFVQNHEAAKLLKTFVHPSKTTVAGDTRFDSVIALAQDWRANDLVSGWIGNTSTVIVAGSTWPSDEEEIVHFAKMNPTIKWVIAPHHVDADSLKETCKLFEYPTLYSQISTQHDGKTALLPNVLIIDNVGMLKYLYKYGTVGYIGGGFTGDGIHNVLEAAIYGKPIIHGPEFSKFPEAQGLLDAGASIVINSALELENELAQLLSNKNKIVEMGKAASGFVHQHAGATTAIIQFIQENRLLTSEKKR